MTTQVHKITLMVIDHDKIGADGVRSAMENTKYPNWCIAPRVVESEARDVEWEDSHPLNRGATWREAFAALFSPPALDLYECETCSAKTGSPTLCGDCLERRDAAGSRWLGQRPRTAKVLS